MNQDRNGDPELYESTIRTTVDEVKGTIDDPGHLIDKNGDANNRFELNRQFILIGNDQAADIVVNDPNATDYIAEITYENGFYILRRLADRAHVTVGLRPVEEHILADGDEIQLADRSFIYRAPCCPQREQD